MKYCWLIIILLSYTCKEAHLENKEYSTDHKLEGFWIRSSSKYIKDISDPMLGCPITDVPIESQYKPYAIGSHFLIKNDSILIFNYPYEYFGIFKYEIKSDSIFIDHNDDFPMKLLIQNNTAGSINFSFNENFNSTCRFTSKASYKPFIPNKELINKLIRD